SCRNFAWSGYRNPNITRMDRTRTAATTQLPTDSHVSSRTRRRSRRRIRAVSASTTGVAVVSRWSRASPSSFSVMAGPFEGAPQRALGVVQAGAHRADGTAGDLGDLLVAHPFDVAQHHGLAVLRGQPVERGVDAGHVLGR